MLIYKFETEDAAIAAKAQCDSYYGYPKEGCVTSSWVDYNFYESGNFYYITFNDSLTVVLGDPIEEDLTFTNVEEVQE
jgi:hypothetical protein